MRLRSSVGFVGSKPRRLQHMVGVFVGSKPRRLRLAMRFGEKRLSIY